MDSLTLGVDITPRLVIDVGPQVQPRWISISALGDVNGDRCDDFLIGVRDHSESKVRAGRVDGDGRRAKDFVCER